MSTLHDNNNGLPAKEPRQWNMDTLPKAHMFQLVKYSCVDLDSYLNLKRVNKHWHAVLTSQTMWIDLANFIFGYLEPGLSDEAKYYSTLFHLKSMGSANVNITGELLQVIAFHYNIGYLRKNPLGFKDIPIHVSKHNNPWHKCSMSFKTLHFELPDAVEKQKVAERNVAFLAKNWRVPRWLEDFAKQHVYPLKEWPKNMQTERVFRSRLHKSIMPPLGKRIQLSVELQFTEMLHFLYAIYSIASKDEILKMVIGEMVNKYACDWFKNVDGHIKRWTDVFVEYCKEERWFIADREQHFRRLRDSKVRRFENTFAEDWALDILKKSKQE